MRFRARTRIPNEAEGAELSRFQLEQAVADGLEAWLASPPSAEFRDAFAADATLVNHCPRHLSSFGGSHVGKAAIASALSDFRTEYLLLDPCLDEILVDGPHVLVTYSVLLRNVGTGRARRLGGIARVMLDDAWRIHRIDNYFDSAALAEVGDLLEDFALRSEAFDRCGMASLAAQVFSSAPPSPRWP